MTKSSAVLSSSSLLKGAVRRAEGFVRYAFSLQYHGGSFLGVSYQGPAGEDCIVTKNHRKQNKYRNRNANVTVNRNCNQNEIGDISDKRHQRVQRVDLRGRRSVEGRLREALDDLFGTNHWENIQVSSRTDRGVHALKNTFHVDIRGTTTATNTNTNTTNTNTNTNTTNNSNNPKSNSIERKLRDGLNFYLSRQQRKQQQDGDDDDNDPRFFKQQSTNHINNNQQLRILNAVRSPEYMDNTEEGKARGQPHRVDWNARFAATQRTYVYRLLLYSCSNSRNTNHDHDNHDQETGGGLLQWSSTPFGFPFEWDRAWCLALNANTTTTNNNLLDINAMQEAAKHLEGTHDFSAFRGRLCQRSSPIVTLKSVDIGVHINTIGGNGSGIGSGTPPHLQQHQQHPPPQQQLVTISFVANSFLYRQVRNMVGCLVEVGKQGGRLTPNDVRELVLQQGASSRHDNDCDNTYHINNNKQQQREHQQQTETTANGLAAQATNTNYTYTYNDTGKRNDDLCYNNNNVNNDDNDDAKPTNHKADSRRAKSDDDHRSHLQSMPRRYTTAPPQGLFLVDVQHGSFRF
mmetsp:Transcript_4742/g.10895  ORF Transcript_4742/g.10895 Transcript_4742/m.10895 type:complete len:573 (-) Transcript_4742:116-1834(-)